MDRTRQLQIVPFSSEFLGPHAISGRGTRELGKGKALFCKRRDTRLREKNVLGGNDRSLNILGDIIAKPTIYCVLSY